MKHLFTALCVVAILFIVGCAKNPVSAPDPVYNVTPSIEVLDPALAWWDMSDSLFSLVVNKRNTGNVVADTASLWLTAYIDSTAYNIEYLGYKSGTWSWTLEDSFCVYRPADSVRLQLTYWIGTGPKNTLDLWTAVRTGAK